MFSFLDHLSDDGIAQRLSPPMPAVFDLPEDGNTASIRRAAVLIPFIRKNNRWEIVFIRRSICERDRHSGQVAFAGGMWSSADETMTDTALREAQEEIGLATKDVKLLGELACHRSIGGIEITPLVGAIPWPYRFQPDPAEVARVFSIPLSWLANPSHYEIKCKTTWAEKKPVKTVYYLPYEGENLWGATARMTLSLVTQLMRGKEGG